MTMDSGCRVSTVGGSGCRWGPQFPGTCTPGRESKLVNGQQAMPSRWAQGRQPSDDVCAPSIGVQNRNSS